jgi:hypothetical protein
MKPLPQLRALGLSPEQARAATSAAATALSAAGEAAAARVLDAVVSRRVVWRADIRDVVADPEWQALRASFLGTWKRTPAENVRVLRAYVGPMTDSARVRRVLNYLTGSGFRHGAIRHPDIDALLYEVREAADRLREEERRHG